MSLAFCFTAISVIACISLAFDFGMRTGGPVLIVWGWIICSGFTICAALSMGEICSTYPQTGSVYYWSSVLAPEGYGPAFSYVTGWFNFLGNAAADAAFAYGFSKVLTGILTVSSYSKTSWPEY